MKTISALRCVPALALVLCLGACALHAEPPPRLFDLGPLPTQAAAAPVSNPWSVQVVAAEDLDVTVMRYRLLYADANVVLAYRDSRWSASPVQLLRRRLATLLSAHGGGEMRVELLVFEQEFAAPDRAQVRARARVSWEQLGQARVADLDVHVDAAPDAAGGEGR